VNTPLVQLGDICEFLDHKRKPVSEELRKPGAYPYYGANGQQGWIDDFIFDEPLVLLAEDGGNFGSKTRPIAYKVSGKTWVNNHAHVLRPLDGCDLDYLTHALSFYDVTKIVSGSTRPKLTKGNAELIRFPLPDLNEQRRIAGELERADGLRRTRRYALELADTFLPAAFLQLFGDLEHGAGDKTELHEVADMITGYPFSSIRVCGQRRHDQTLSRRKCFAGSN
jgi:type I restriction enzyme S subunit